MSRPILITLLVMLQASSTACSHTCPVVALPNPPPPVVVAPAPDPLPPCKLPARPSKLAPLGGVPDDTNNVVTFPAAAIGRLVAYLAASDDRLDAADKCMLSRGVISAP